jgi:hypothetical protein
MPPRSGLPPEIANQRVDPIPLQFDKPPGIQVREPSPSGLSQSVQLGRFQRFPPLDQAQPLPQDLARILIPARGHEVAYDPLMMVGQNDVPCGHPGFSLQRARKHITIGIICQPNDASMCRLPINLPPVTNPHDQDHQHVFAQRINNPPIANAKPIPIAAK